MPVNSARTGGSVISIVEASRPSCIARICGFMLLLVFMTVIMLFVLSALVTVLLLSVTGAMYDRSMKARENNNYEHVRVSARLIK